MRFQWLKDYQELENQILYLKWNLSKSRLELSRWIFGDLSDVRLEKKSRSSSLEENIAKIENEIEILEEQRKEMLAIINSFNGIDNEIVRKKYIEGCSLDIIAEEIGYSSSYVRQRHAEIKRTLNFLDQYESEKQDKRNKVNDIDAYNRVANETKQISLF